MAAQTDYFLAVDGDDANPGTSQAGAFATLQRGIDALEPGDTLTLLPGEYPGSARSEGLGNDDMVTTLRALIPGTAVVRGDVDAPSFEKVAGYRFVYSASVPGEVHGVNELDSLAVLRETASIGDVDIRPGTFYHDQEEGVLYISTPDFESAEGRRFTICVIPDHGLYLAAPRQVHIEGIDFRGFQRLSESHRHDRAGNANWGLFISNGYRCVIRDCRAYFNNRGLGMSSDGVGREESDPEIGHNLIAHSTAWANRTIYGWGGAINFFSPRQDEIRHCLSFRNGGIGIRMYQGDHFGLTYRNLAWGNGAQIDLKADASVTSLRNVGIGRWGSDTVRRKVVHSLVGAISSIGEQFENNIVLEDFSVPPSENPYRDMDLAAEFADPFHHDYRLQATSRFRGAASDGTDLGPFEYTPAVYFVSPEGNDEADGLSVAEAWQTLERVSGHLKAGDTLYLFPGRYEESLVLSGLRSESDEPVRLRTRGTGRAVIAGPVQFDEMAHVVARDLEFASSVEVNGGEALVFEQCLFSGVEGGLKLSGTTGTRLVHNTFETATGPDVQGEESTEIFIAGNHFKNGEGTAVKFDDADAVLYSNFNTYADGIRAWQVGGESYPWPELPNHWETGSVVITDAGERGEGPYGRLAGVYSKDPELPLIESKPELLAATATTANFEWYSTARAIFTVAWGEDPESLQEAEVYGENFFTFSVTGLEPGRDYLFQLVGAESVSRNPDQIEYEEYRVNSEPLAFQTDERDRAPRVFYVGSDGDDQADGTAPGQAWSSFFHATTQLRPGDTLRVLDGDYAETVRVRTTGTPDSPIRIEAAPGATVVFDSDGKLSNYFVVDYKDHIRLDGFYMRSVYRHGAGNLFRGSGIRARSSADLEITRCMIDGRGTSYAGPLLNAYSCPDLLVKNCVQIDNMGATQIIDSPGARISHCVFLRSKIAPLKFLNRPGDTAILENSILTDSLPTKADSTLIAVGYYPMLQTDNNGFHFRRPGDERTLLGVYGEIAYERSANAYHLEGRESDPAHPFPEEVQRKIPAAQWHEEMYPDGDFIEGDPGFAIIARNADDIREMQVAVRERRPTWQTFDWLMSGDRRRERLGFSDLLATDPEFVTRGIGLQPEAFEDFE